MTTLVASVTMVTLVNDVTATPTPTVVTFDSMVTLVTKFIGVPWEMWLRECNVKAVPLRTYSALFYSLLHTKLTALYFHVTRHVSAERMYENQSMKH